MSQDTDGQQGRPRSFAGAIVAIAAIAIAGAAWYWATRQPEPGALPQGVVFVGGLAAFAALVAQIRALSALDMIEAVWHLIAGAFVVIGALLKGLWDGLMGLLGFD